MFTVITAGHKDHTNQILGPHTRTHMRTHTHACTFVAHQFQCLTIFTETDWVLLKGTHQIRSNWFSLEFYAPTHQKVALFPAGIGNCSPQFTANRGPPVAKTTLKLLLLLDGEMKIRRKWRRLWLCRRSTIQKLLEVIPKKKNVVANVIIIQHSGEKEFCITDISSCHKMNVERTFSSLNRTEWSHWSIDV